MKIALFQTNEDHQALRSYGSLSEIFKYFAAGTNVNSFDVFPVYNNILPDQNYKADIYLITGSKHSVNEDLDWIHNLRGFIQERLANDNGEKFLGFCFGHQMLASALGASVSQGLRREWNAGVKPLSVIERKDWMHPFKPELELGFMHRDHAELPEGAIRLAGTPDCPNQMFEKDGRVLGIQAHPEYSVARIEKAMAIAGIADDEKKHILDNKNRLADDAHIIQSWVQNFMCT